LKKRKRERGSFGDCLLVLIEREYVEEEEEEEGEEEEEEEEGKP
jgi:hypothetical protein